MSQVSAKRRWLSSERIAQAVLRELGFEVLEVRKKIVLNGVEVGEADAVVRDQSGEVYAVEVKAGRLDVGGVRQAYVNAVLLGAKPMVVCKGFADDAAAELAEKLGVRVLQLSDVFLVESEELYVVVKEVVEEALVEYFELFYGFEPQLKPEHYSILEAIYRSSTLEEAAERLGMSADELAKKLGELRKQGILPKWADKYATIRRVARLLIQKQSIASALEDLRRLGESVRRLGEEVKKLEESIRAVSAQVGGLSLALSKLEPRQ
jgi:predicted RecB family endonuclease